MLDTKTVEILLRGRLAEFSDKAAWHDAGFYIANKDRILGAPGLKMVLHFREVEVWATAPLQ